MELLLAISLGTNVVVILAFVFHNRDRDERERLERQEFLNRLAAPGTIFQDELEGELVQPDPVDDDAAYFDRRQAHEAAREARDQAELALERLDEN